MVQFCFQNYWNGAILKRESRVSLVRLYCEEVMPTLYNFDLLKWSRVKLAQLQLKLELKITMHLSRTKLTWLQFILPYTEILSRWYDFN